MAFEIAVAAVAAVATPAVVGGAVSALSDEVVIVSFDFGSGVTFVRGEHRG